jgi:TonB-dependent SusC/RagA subfamily outer membrane receptor
MASYPARVLIPITVVAGLNLACAHHNKAATVTTPSPAPQQSPPASELTTARQSTLSLEQMLAGRISGVEVARAPGGGIAVQIRGPASFYLTNEPLYVVDGAAVQPGPNGALSWLRPEDIESILVLRGADATIYGVRGGNGVVVIKTKGTH